jgi:hypothetical protein
MNFSRIITGDNRRKSRLHNYRGQRLDLGGFLYLPQCLASTLRFKLTGHRPAVPYLGYRAVKRLDELIQPDWKVLEFGSGMSTIWLARRCQRLVSIETNLEWYEQIKPQLPENVDYRFVPEEECHLGEYRSFDLAIVDGVRRDKTMQTAIRAAQYIFMDNSDVKDSEYQTARKLLLDSAQSVEVFNDLYPTYFSVGESILGLIQ